MGTNRDGSSSNLRQRRPTNVVAPTATKNEDPTNPKNDTTNENNTSSPSSSSTSIVMIHLYSIIWCIHYLVPYLDSYLYHSTEAVVFRPGKTMKFMPALDHRPIDVTMLDAYVLLPLVIYILYLYMIRYRNDIFTSRGIDNATKSKNSIHIFILRYVYIAHAIDTILIRGMIRMPYVWDHEQWASLCNLMFLACYTVPLFNLDSSSSQTITTMATTNWFLKQESFLLGTLYGAAAFWKLTTSFWYHTTSCGSSLVLETIATYVPGKQIPESLAQFAVHAGPILTFAVEAGISMGMIYLAGTRHAATVTTTWKAIRNVLVIFTAVFHLTIYMLPINAAGGFSLDCLTRLLFFFHPQEIYETLVIETPGIYFKVSRFRVWAICSMVWIRYKGTGYPMDIGYLFYGFLFDLYIMIMLPSSTKHNLASIVQSEHPIPSITKRLSTGMLLVGLLYGVGGTILGLEQMGAPTMYSNLRSYYGGNHLLVPTGILGDDILYGGRMVQVTYSTCDTLNQMLGYIDSADLEPEHLYAYQKSLLRNASIPNTPIQNQNLPIQFLPLCLSNPHSKKLVADYYRRSNPIGQPVPFQFILPINVVKRAIRKARDGKESFVVKIADGGKSSELKHPPTLEVGVTEVVILNEQGECRVELYQPTSDSQNNNQSSGSSTTSNECHDHYLAQMLQRDEGHTWMDYIVSRMLIPYPQLVGESQEVCMS